MGGSMIKHVIPSLILVRLNKLKKARIILGLAA
jgi:hypothetical protein